MTQPEIPRPEYGDVVDLILADHRLFESFMHQIRDETQDREALRSALSAVLVAHAEAEEEHVYPTLVKKDAIEDDDAEHSTHEHHEINTALLRVLEVSDTGSEDFSQAVEGLTKALAHHLDEEEREILNPARTDLPESTRTELGATFASERSRLLDDDCGSLEHVRELVAKAKAQGD